MRPKTKRMVAREGLIIIGLLLLGGISSFLDWWSNNQRQLYYANVQEIQLTNPPQEPMGKEVTLTPITKESKPRDLSEEQGLSSSGDKPRDVLEEAGITHRLDTQGSSFGLERIVLQFPRNTDKNIIKQTIKKDFPSTKADNWIVWDSPNGKNISASYNEKGERAFNSFVYKVNYTYASIFFFILAYPLYLLARFVVWALWTLRKKTAIDGPI